ncbi:MAG: sugar phosphate isomerase/epimerase family protein [Myxococcota bacterium]
MGVRAGLCSITLRALAADDVLRTAERGGLEAIEWGADVHCPPGSDGRALAASCRAAGIECLSYGSYYMAGQTDPGEWPAVLDTAESLGARTVRVWARFGVVPESPAEEKQPVIEALAHAVREAETRGLRVGLEYHGGTLSQTLTSTLETLDAVDAPLLSYWQPSPDPEVEESRDALQRLAPRLGHLHVFSWTGPEAKRIPMASCRGYWDAVLATAVALPRPDTSVRAAYLEYVPDDDPEAVVREAGFLCYALARAGRTGAHTDRQEHSRE